MKLRITILFAMLFAFAAQSQHRIELRPYLYGGDSSDRFAYRENGKYGLENTDSLQITPAVYDSIEQAGDGGYIVHRFKPQHLVGLIGRSGKELLPIQFEMIDRVQQNVYKAGKPKCFKLYDDYGKTVYNKEIHELSGLKISSENGKNATVYKMREASDSTSIALLTIKDGTPIKIIGGCSSITMVTENLAIYKKGKTENFGVVDALSGKIAKLRFSNVFFDTKLQLLVGSVGKTFDAIIPPSLEIRRAPAKIDKYANGWFFYNANGKRRVMDKNFRTLPLEYSTLLPFFQESGNHVIAAQRTAMLMNWFYFSSGSKKRGVIDASGKIIVAENKYDSIYLLPFRANNSAELYNNQYLNQSVLGLRMICEMKTGNTKSITIRNEFQPVATFSVNENEDWAFAKSANAIIIRSKETAKVFAIDQSKFILEVSENQFQEDVDGGFTQTGKLDENRSVRTKYSRRGNAIATGIFPSAQYTKFSNQKQYVSKKNGKFGVVDIDGNVLLPFESDTLYTADERWFIGTKDGRSRIVDLQNIEILSGFDKAEWQSFGDYSMQRYYIVTQNGKLTVYNWQFDQLVIADQIEVTHRHIIAKDGKNMSAYTPDGRKLLTIQSERLYDYYAPFYTFVRNGKSGLVKPGGTIVLPAKYSNPMPFENSRYFIEEKDNRKSMIDAAGKIFVRDFISANGFNIPGKKYYAVNNANGQSALYDENFKRIIPFAKQQFYNIVNDNFILLHRGQYDGVINFKGEVVIPFVFIQIYPENDTNFFTVRTATENLRYKIVGDTIVPDEKK